MDSAPVVVPPAQPKRPSMSGPRLANGHGNNLGLKPASSSSSSSSSSGPGPGDIEKEDARGAVAPGGGSNNVRRRRRQRLVDVNQARMAARSPPTISEDQSYDHSAIEKRERASLSDDITEDTTMLSADDPDSTPDGSVRVKKLPITPIKPGAPAPQSILASTKSFPPPDKQTSHIPPRLSASMRDTSAPDSLSSSSSGNLPRRLRSQSLWDEKSNGTRQKSRKQIPTVPALSMEGPAPQHLPMPKSKVQKAKLKRYATAPSSSTLSDNALQTNVVDDALMDRAFIIRQNLVNFEMQELAAEAERAAESGLEKFVGSASKFGVEKTPPYRPRILDDEESFVVNASPRANASPGLMTPMRRKALVDTLAAYPMEYTPSYFQRKKIPVTSLRNFLEIVPNFADMHNNIRLHLGREGVDTATLPDMYARRSLVKTDTDETRDTKEEEADETFSQAPSVAASHAEESVSSFSTFAAQSLSSLKEMIHFVKGPKVVDNSLRPSASMPNPSPRYPVPRDIQQSSSLRNVSSDMGESVSERTNPPLPRTSAFLKPLDTAADPDSDDSSVEFYGRKTPIDSSNQSISSHFSELSRKSALPGPRSVSSSGDIHQPILQKRRTKARGGANVSFETEKANYQALLDRMQQKTSPSVLFNVDPIDVDILPSSSTIKSNQSTPMANFLSKLGNTFSRSNSKDATRKSPKSTDENSKHFVSNFFYTNETTDVVDLDDVVSHKLEINPQRRRDAYCLPGCEPTDLLAACDVATKYADKLFEWFNAGDDSQRRKTNAIIDPKSQDDTSRDTRRRRIFVPPKLSAWNTETHEEDDWHECGDTLACPEVKEPIMGCSPG